MKQIFIAALAICGALPVVAQCNQNAVITSSQTEYLNAEGVLQRTVDEQSVIEITKEQVTITAGNNHRKMIGKVQSDSCVWATPYKQGVSVIHAAFEDPSVGKRDVKLTISGDGSKVSFLMEIAGIPDRRIRVKADEYKALTAR